MTKEQCIQFAAENPICTVATVDGDAPKARIFMLWRACEDGFYFSTRTIQRTYSQLKSNPKIELCFYKQGSDENDLGAMLRVAGSAEFVDDRSLKEQLLAEWPFLMQMGLTGPDDPTLILLKIAAGKMEYWTATDGPQEITD